MTKKNNKKKTQKKSGSGWFSQLKNGRTLSLDFLKENAWLLIAIVVCVIALMGLRYKTRSKMAEIKSLDVELERAESNKLHEKALYMTIIRETEMRKMVAAHGLPLQFQEKPPYELIE